MASRRLFLLSAHLLRSLPCHTSPNEDIELAAARRGGKPVCPITRQRLPLNLLFRHNRSNSVPGKGDQNCSHRSLFLYLHLTDFKLGNFTDQTVPLKCFRVVSVRSNHLPFKEYQADQARSSLPILMHVGSIATPLFQSYSNILYCIYIT